MTTMTGTRASYEYRPPALPTIADHRRAFSALVDAKMAEAELKFRHLAADGDRSGARDRLSEAMSKLILWKARLG